MDDLSHPAEDATPTRPGKFILWLAAAVFTALLVVLFYAFENWRGERIWRQHKATLAAQGRPLDWSSFIPDRPPDSSNVIKSGALETWIYKGQAQLPPAPPAANSKPTSLRDSRIQLGRLEILPSAPIAFDTIKTNPVALRRTLEQHLGRRFISPLGFTIYVAPENPPAIQLAAAKTPGAGELTELLAAADKGLSSGLIAVEPAGPASFAFYGDQKSWVEAREYLAREEHLPRLRDLREAAARPFVYLDGDYSSPETAPIQNLPAIRHCAQNAATRAQCFLALKRPAEAFDQLSFLHDVRRVLESKPDTLVAVMFATAIAGLNHSVAEEGFAAGLWTRPEWEAFARQPIPTNQFARIRSALQSERIGNMHWLEKRGPQIFGEVYSLLRRDEKHWWQRKDLRFRLIPRGWFFQGLAAYSHLIDETAAALDERDRIDPEKLRRVTARIDEVSGGVHPRRIVTAVAMPKIEKACNTTARMITTGNFVRIAGGLELYKSENGRYPDSLGALAPAFIASVPQDCVTGEPLRYRRLENSYVLHAAGWNGKDDFTPIIEAFERDPARQFFRFDPAETDDLVWRGAPPIEERAARKLESAAL